MVTYDKNAKNVRYIAVFFDAATQCFIRGYSKEGLDNPTGDLHVTVQYKPEDDHSELFGEKVSVKVVAYGNNGRNEGLKVEVIAENAELQALLDGIAVPHITLSWSKDSKAVFTKDVCFDEPVDGVIIEGTFGAFIKG